MMRTFLLALALSATNVANVSAQVPSAALTTGLRAGVPAGKLFGNVWSQSGGYDVTYTEVPGGNHAPRWWQQRLPEGIVLSSGGWTRR